MIYFDQRWFCIIEAFVHAFVNYQIINKNKKNELQLRIQTSVGIKILQRMSPVSPVFHTVETVRITLNKGAASLKLMAKSSWRCHFFSMTSGVIVIIISYSKWRGGVIIIGINQLPIVILMNPFAIFKGHFKGHF